MVGREGMLGANLALGVSTANLRALVQGAGGALRVSAAALKRERPLSRDGEDRRVQRQRFGEHSLPFGNRWFAADNHLKGDDLLCKAPH